MIETALMFLIIKMMTIDSNRTKHSSTVVIEMMITVGVEFRQLEQIVMSLNVKCDDNVH